MLTLDAETLNVIFQQPRIDGRFEGKLAETARKLGQKRPLVLFAFAPKSAGTFFRTAAIIATDGQLVRGVHALGGRDGAPYLPTFLLYYLGGVCAGPMVTHIHMQAFAANRHFMDAFDLKPIIMVRNIPDMLASYIDMLDTDAGARLEGLNCLIPQNFLAMSAEDKADFVIDVLGPWYASYFATWLDYAKQSPDRVCVLTYAEFCETPAATLAKALAHAGIPRTHEQCQQALNRVWQERGKFRFNQGQSGRGGSYFNAEQISRIARMVSHYGQIAPWRDQLLAATPPESLRAAG
jgi:hypothetical protein